MIEFPAVRSLRLPWTVAMIVAAAAVGRADAPSDPVAETMDGFASAIRLRGQIADEKRDWARQERILRAEIHMLEAEISETRRQIESLRSERSEVLEKRERLLARKEEEETALDRIETLIGRISEPFEQLVERLPEWIEDTGGDSEGDSFAVLRRLRAIQAANQRVWTLPMEVADPADGESVRVDVLSFGLGGAFFASRGSDFSGRFVFDGNGWSVEIIPDFASPIRDGILQEEGLGEPRFLPLPVSIGGSR
ncbi:MAG: hypothetical protein ACLFRP_01475 [Puniceicoccaceae bacterium]